MKWYLTQQIISHMQWIRYVLMICSLILWSTSAFTNTSSTPLTSHVHLPLSFIPDQNHESKSGKNNSFMVQGVQHQLRISADTTWLYPTITTSQPGSAIAFSWLGTNSAARLIGLQPLSGQIHWLKGRDKSKWHSVQPYAQLQVEQLYPGIDLLYYGNQQRLEYDLILAPGAEVATIRMSFKGEGIQGIRIDETGGLLIDTVHGMLYQLPPVIYQTIAEKRRTIAGYYQLYPQPDGLPQLGFKVAAYDTQHPLIIDPILEYASYLGGSGEDTGMSVAVDDQGDVYVAGVTNSIDFPIDNPLQGAWHGQKDLFVMKFNAAGDTLIYATYLGGSGEDIMSKGSRSIAVDDQGQLVIVGSTSSAVDFPLLNALQSSYGGGDFDVVVAKLTSDGSGLLFATYLGGTDKDKGLSLALNHAAEIYLTGHTFSSDFPTQNPWQMQHGGNTDGFVVKLSAAGDEMLYGSLLGGNSADHGKAITLNQQGHIIVAGVTQSKHDFPTTSAALQSQYGGGKHDAFVTVIAADGQQLLSSTYLGGSDIDKVRDVTVNDQDQVWLVGLTKSRNFPLVNAIQSQYGGGKVDGFIVQLSADAKTLISSTYLGGTDIDRITAVALDEQQQPYFTGFSRSSNWPVTAEAIQTIPGGNFDGIIGQLDRLGQSLLFSSYFGGQQAERGFGLAVDPQNDVYVVGETESGVDFPYQQALQPLFGGGPRDGFIVKLNQQSDQQPPVVTAPVDLVVEATALFTEVTLGNATAEDDQDGTLPVTPNTTGPFGLGVHEVIWRATDTAGNVGIAIQTITVQDTTPPQLTVPADIAITSNDPIAVDIGQASATDIFTPIAVTHNAPNLFPVGETTVLWNATDPNNNVTTATQLITITEDDGLPSDPETVAPELDPTVVTHFEDSTEFLYSGGDPIQTGVTAGAINTQQAAVIRGKVLDKDNQPLSGVTITIKDHDEFGQTLSRADGQFDLAVNGGGQLTINYVKADYLPLQRQVNAPWQDFVHAEDVVMIAVDTQVTAIDLSDTTTDFQVAQGSLQSDAAGTRQATVLFPQGTNATMTLPDGSSQALSSLNVRATEYTVGGNGPAAMPGPLPATSGYTYAVELSVDAALAAGATRVDFDQSLPFYVDNFLNFPTGEVVPVGWYDRDQSAWIPAPNGRVIEILNITDGLANLDVDGSGSVADAAGLSTLGITDAERAYLAQTYTAGKSLWRTPITHFTPWDCNWPYGPPDGAEPPPENDPAEELPPDPKDDCTQAGCIIQALNQTLGEDVDIVGTPFSLHYRSNRTPGYTANRTLEIILTEDSVPTVLKRIDLTIEVAGQSHELSFTDLSANQTYAFTWDGLDAYGRTIATTQARITLGYVYDLVYYAADADFEASFAQFGAVDIISGNRFQIIGTREDQEMSSEKQWVQQLGFLSSNVGLGSWTINVHHAYDPVGQVLYGGDGDSRSAQNIVDIITTVAGRGYFNFSGDGGLATEADLYKPKSVAVAPDGSLYIADTSNHRIRKVDPEGVITTIAGTGQNNNSGDGGLAIAASLSSPGHLSLGPDGSLYLSTEDPRYPSVRKIDPQGLITTVAGGLYRGFSGDGGLATQAQFFNIEGIAVSPDGNLYIADSGNRRVRKVDPQGIVSTVAGNGWNYPSGNNVPAREAGIATPVDVELGSDGSLYISCTYGGANSYNVVRKVDPQGILSTIAGRTGYGYSGDGGLATEALLFNQRGISVGSDDSLYIADDGNGRLRKVDSRGIITTIAGRGYHNYTGDDGPATEADFRDPYDVALGPEGALYIADSGNHRIRRISTLLAEVPQVGEITLTSEDGKALYRFSGTGRHLSTLDTTTGTTQYSFDYTEEGLLSSITDMDGDVTTIERDASGVATALLASDGQRTEFTINSDGYLSQITDPKGDSRMINYTDAGLMTQYTDARGNSNTFTYDAQGRLIEDEDPVGGGWTLTRTEQDAGYSVTMTSGEGRNYGYTFQHLTTGDRLRTQTAPDGTQSSKLFGTDSSETTTAADGTITVLEEGPDPRFGMVAPVPETYSITTPSGLAYVQTTSRNATLTDSEDLFSHSQLSETINLNGQAYNQVFNTNTSTYTNTTPTGRQITTVINAQGRPTQQTINGLNAVNYSYDNRGRLTQINSGSGNDLRSTSYTYNSAGFLDTLTDAQNQQTTFGYDAAGRITQQTLPDGRSIQYGYDANGNLTSLTPPGRTAHQFHYTAMDLESTYTPPDISGITNPSTQYQYNLDRQLTQVTRPDGSTVVLSYDGTSGQLTDQTLPRGTYSYSYNDTTGQLSSITTPDNNTLSYSYDGFLPLSYTWGGTVTGTVSQTYNTNFLVTQRSINNAHAIAFYYDNDNLLTDAGTLFISRNNQNGLITGTLQNNLATTRGYNGFGEMATYNASHNVNTLYDVSYVRDLLGRIIQQTEILQGTITTYSYQYDAAGRLEQSTVDNVTTIYTYDNNSNRTHVDGILLGTYDAQDRLTQYGNTTYNYNDNGELLSKTNNAQTTNYNYDILGNLIGITLPNGTEIGYLIDGQNRRIGKTVNGTLTQGLLYKDQLNPIAELDADGAIVSRFVYADKPNVPAYMEKGGNTYRIISDHLGSPRLVVNIADGSVVQRMDYDVWGSVIQDTNPGFQPFGFAGGLYDRDTGFVRFGARDYDAEVGRWTAKDPIRFDGGVNLYGYAANDPVNWGDADGLVPVPVVTAGVGFVVGAAAGGYQAYNSGGSFFAGAARGGLVGAATGFFGGVGFGAGGASAAMNLTGSGFGSAIGSAVGGLIGNALAGFDAVDQAMGSPSTPEDGSTQPAPTDCD